MTVKKIGLAAGKVLAVVAAFGLGLLVAAPAQAATTYNRTAAVTYAQRYSCNNDTSCRNTGTYNTYGADCTNFVSQAMKAGGRTQFRSTSPNWYWTNKNDESKSWRVVPDLYTFVKSGSRSVTWSVTMSAQYTSASPGDLYMYDWGTGEGWSHLSMETGYGAFAANSLSYDKKSGMRYTSITHGKGDYVAQHTTDRDGSPWNLGYQTERNSTIRAKMKTVIIHLSTTS